LAGVVFGYGVLWEVFTHTIRPYVVVPLTAWIGFRACVALSIIGAMAIALVGVDLWSLETSVKIETMFMSLQAIALMAMIVLVVYKRLPVGRNTLGMAVGYGIVLISGLICLGLIFFGVENTRRWENYIHAFSCWAAPGVWCATLWKYQPNQILDALHHLLRNVSGEITAMAASHGRLVSVDDRRGPGGAR